MTRLFLWLCLILTACGREGENDRIDRERLVRRHLVEVNAVDTLSSLTVGNGAFAFTVDFTGLQSYPELYEMGVPLGTQSEWGWHSFPDTGGYTLGECSRKYPYYGREVPYLVQGGQPDRRRDAVAYFRQNPHRLHLGQVGMEMVHADGSPVRADEIGEIRQVLDPWTGTISSRFTIDGEPVEVQTVCHPRLDLVSARIESPLTGQGRIRIKIRFPYPDGKHSSSGCDWNKPGRHRTTLRPGENEALIERQLDSTSYQVATAWKGRARVTQPERHTILLSPDPGTDSFSFSCLFTDEPQPEGLPDFGETDSLSRIAWKEFWMSGGAVDFSGSTDPRAKELERRVVLSQYLTRVQCAGSMPPQETGLTYNSWYGKFHLEMHWWHGVHFAQWGRADLLERSFGYYRSIAGRAGRTAHWQGFEGIRWPKMTGPRGRESPSSTGAFLIWQQPHLIMMAELCYRDNPKKEFLEKYADLVFQAAGFMASYAHYDTAGHRFVLGPLLIPAQERLPFDKTVNPPFELVYWKYGLETAQQWRERLGLERVQEWDRVIGELSVPAQKDGLYLAAESAPDSYENERYMGDHPIVLGACGMLPDEGMLDPEVMKSTFAEVWNHWHWDETWGWDFPMTAMAAARLGMPGYAVDALFMDEETNTYLPNGHNYQDGRLRVYLPGNGGLLSAVAMMCTGWEGGPGGHAPGFPDNGTWTVRWEGLKKAW